MVVSFFKKHHGRSGAKIDASREEQSKIIIDLQTQNSVLNSQVATLQKELVDASQKNKITELHYINLLPRTPTRLVFSLK